ncbi:MAG: hypothetical protein ACR5K9_07410 [Wolbachia sp.]
MISTGPRREHWDEKRVATWMTRRGLLGFLSFQRVTLKSRNFIK